MAALLLAVIAACSSDDSADGPVSTTAAVPSDDTGTTTTDAPALGGDAPDSAEVGPFAGGPAMSNSPYSQAETARVVTDAVAD